MHFYLTNVCYLLSTAQGQVDYSAAWAAYYQYYQHQAAAAAGQAAPGMFDFTV